MNVIRDITSSLKKDFKKGVENIRKYREYTPAIGIKEAGTVL
jgi:hypothetical protein